MFDTIEAEEFAVNHAIAVFKGIDDKQIDDAINANAPQQDSFISRFFNRFSH